MANRRILIAQQLRRAIELLVQNLPIEDSDALAISDVFEMWEAHTKYKAGTIVKYGEEDDGSAIIYSVVSEHTSQEDWPPDLVPALYKRIGFSDGFPVWVQPISSADAYSKDDVVSHKGSTWVSDLDYNVWEPGVYGWSIKD